MILYSLISVGVGAMLGGWLRWILGIFLNPVFPTLPLGTLAANLIGGFLMGIFIEATKMHLIVSETARLAIATGFLGGLTTFSTFSGETVTLLSNHQFFWSAIIVIVHVLGSLVATILGVYMMKVLTF